MDYFLVDNKERENTAIAINNVFTVLNNIIFPAGSLCMMNGPKCVEGGEKQETVASLLVAVLVLGIGGYRYMQCSGSGIRCLFDPWIRDPE